MAAEGTNPIPAIVAGLPSLPGMPANISEALPPLAEGADAATRAMHNRIGALSAVSDTQMAMHSAVQARMDKLYASLRRQELENSVTLNVNTINFKNSVATLRFNQLRPALAKVMLAEKLLDEVDPDIEAIRAAMGVASRFLQLNVSMLMVLDVSNWDTANVYYDMLRGEALQPSEKFANFDWLTVGDKVKNNAAQVAKSLKDTKQSDGGSHYKHKKSQPNFKKHKPSPPSPPHSA